jgi:ABC-type multidrug transport system ATPase subunit
VLHGVSACVPVRSLSAVLGPSGAGKSSLFDVLLGEAEMEYVDGNAPLQEKVAYVTQDAQLVVSETVLDVMWFYANLALPRYTPMAHRRQLIEDILFAMDMSHTQVRVPQPFSCLHQTNASHPANDPDSESSRAFAASGSAMFERR